jgi:hypothetical protein
LAGWRPNSWGLERGGVQLLSKLTIKVAIKHMNNRQEGVSHNSHSTVLRPQGGFLRGVGSKPIVQHQCCREHNPAGGWVPGCICLAVEMCSRSRGLGQLSLAGRHS